MLRFTLNAVRLLALCLTLSASIDVVTAAETLPIHPAAASKPSSGDMTKWIMNLWEGRWVPAERNHDRPYV